MRTVGGEAPVTTTAIPGNEQLGPIYQNIQQSETLAGDGGSTKKKKEKEKKKEAGGMMVQSSADYGVTLRAFPRIYPHNKRRRTDDRR
jgi:hypothetical protein